MDFYDALANKGKPVRYRGEEYILLQVTKRKMELAPGIPNPFMVGEYDGMIYHRETNSAKMVPIEAMEAVSRELFRRKLLFGEEPVRESEEILLEG